MHECRTIISKNDREGALIRGPALPVEAGQVEIGQVVLQGKHAPCRVAPARPSSEMLHSFGNKVSFDGSMSLRLVFDLRGTKSPFQCTKNNHYVLRGNDDKLFQS